MIKVMKLCHEYQRKSKYEMLIHHILQNKDTDDIDPKDF